MKTIAIPRTREREQLPFARAQIAATLAHLGLTALREAENDVMSAERLRGALINLIVNARQAVNGRAPAAGAPNVTLSTRSTPQGVAITVTDNGSGIGDADLPRVFDPYFTTKRGGTGLGLPIAKNIIEGLGGVLSVVSTAGQGTEMRIEFPTL